MTIRNTLTKGAWATALAAATLAGATTSASANSAPYIGDGYPNNTHAVWCVQNSVNYAISHYAFGQYPAIAEDGVWGPRTKAAVQEFQYLFSANTTGVMVQDGIVGRMTGEHLLQYGDPYYTGGPVQPSDAYCTRYLPNGF
ncbi:peptidoglycan-binding protein [Kitasatospora indigofera]|uniref:peptidoglycan-binding domain-containing protein n=1 Tax=Kitasatospora indigofera TaxID=67307 RepID=UPI00369FE1D4